MFGGGGGGWGEGGPLWTGRDSAGIQGTGSGKFGILLTLAP